MFYEYYFIKWHGDIGEINMDIEIYRVDDGTTYTGRDGKEYESYTYWLVCGKLKQPITINTFKGKYPNFIRFFPVKKVTKEQFNQI